MGDPKKTSTKYYETLYKECHIHMQLDHPNIIKLYKVFFEDGMVYLVLEYADSGDL
jgi:calcium-dependent protein kinase